MNPQLILSVRKYLNNQNWNIGFACVTSAELISRQSLPKIHWMKHPYRDRFFADPFILNIDDDYIFVLVEELIFGEKGTLVWLKVDSKTYKLKDRKQLLKLDTHLSYPQIVRHNGEVYVVPENSESGGLTAYKYNNKTISLTPVGVIADDPLTDATILTTNDGDTYMLATILPNSQQDAFLYKYDSESQKFRKTTHVPVVSGLSMARPGGSFFHDNNRIFRPAQDCESGYGKAITICEITSFSPSYNEHPIFRIEPCSWRYNLGLHTLNFAPSSPLAVIDSYGYLYPFWGRVFMSLYKLKKLFYGRKSI